jgi:sialate O-acetylesterase
LIIASTAVSHALPEIGKEIPLTDGSTLMISDEVRPGTRVVAEIITDVPGPQPWDQLRVLVDYHAPADHVAINWIDYGGFGITRVTGERRDTLYKAENRGKPSEWRRVQLDITQQGVALNVDLRDEFTIPWKDGARKGSIAFAAKTGVSGRVILRQVAPIPSNRDGPLHVSELFASHAVLPHGVSLPVWGKATPNATVEVSVDGKPVASATADAQGHWTATLPAQQPGGPHELLISSDGRSIRCTDVHFGIVWLCSGQSNMVWRIRQSDDPDKESLRALDYPLVRTFLVNETPAPKPVDLPESLGQWHHNDISAARNLSAIAQIVGQQLHDALKIPVGLIVAVRSGSRIEPWLPADELQELETQLGPYPEDYRERMAKHENPPCSLFNGMIAPLARLPISGIVWYQGESNAWRGWHYAHQLRSYLKSQRRVFGRSDMPVVVVQLPVFGKDMDPNAATWAELRYAQASVAAESPHTFLASIIDLGNPNDIHPTRKRPVAERIAALLLRHVYDKSDVVADPPVLSKAVPTDTGMILHFDQPITVDPDSASDFQMARDNEGFLPATSIRQTTPTTIELSWPNGMPNHVRYAWKNVVKATLRGATGLAVAPFRTDDRPLESQGKF